MTWRVGAALPLGHMRPGNGVPSCAAQVNGCEPRATWSTVMDEGMSGGFSSLWRGTASGEELGECSVFSFGQLILGRDGRPRVLWRASVPASRADFRGGRGRPPSKVAPGRSLFRFVAGNDDATVRAWNR